MTDLRKWVQHLPGCASHGCGFTNAGWQCSREAGHWIHCDREYGHAFIPLPCSPDCGLDAALRDQPEPLESLKNRDTPEGNAFWDYIEKAKAEWFASQPAWAREHITQRDQPEPPDRYVYLASRALASRDTRG